MPQPGPTQPGAGVGALATLINAEEDGLSCPVRGLTAGVRALSGMDPDLTLFAFRPALLFESGLAVDYHVFRRQWVQVAVLAGAGSS